MKLLLLLLNETRQEFFFTKVTLVQSITDIVLLDFWLMLLSWMFTSCYTTIYFFVKKFICSNVYISVNTIFECLYVFFGWEGGHQLSTYPTGGGMGEGHPKCVQLHKGWIFCAEVRSSLSKFPFVSCWSCSCKMWKNKIRDYHQKLNILVPLQIAKLFQIVGNEEILRLFTWVFID